MPELHFKGKEFVFNHHLSVPCRPLVPDPARSIGPARMDGNLEALQELLPVYAGKIDCLHCPRLLRLRHHEPRVLAANARDGSSRRLSRLSRSLAPTRSPSSACAG